MTGLLVSVGRALDSLCLLIWISYSWQPEPDIIEIGMLICQTIRRVIYCLFGRVRRVGGLVIYK